MKKILILCTILATVILTLVSCKSDSHIHSFGEWEVRKPATCSTEGERARYCSCGEKQIEVIYATGEHTEVIIPAVDPTCLENGLTEGKRCSKCGEILVEQEIINACHVLANGKCENCDYTYSMGLEYISNGDGTCYVSGIGTCTDTNVVIPPISPDGDRVTALGDFSFVACFATSIVIPNSVTSIGDRVFYYCYDLTSIIVDSANENYKAIDGNLYTKDGKILLQYAIGKTESQFTIPNGVTTIGDYAFLQSVLTSIVIPASVTTIGDYAFLGCDDLTSITVDSTNEYYKAIDGNLYSKDGKTIVQYAVGKTDSEFAIPNGVTTIGCGAFAIGDNLTSVVIPNSVTYIGEGAFSDCRSLTSISIPTSVTYIGDAAFAVCNFTFVVIPDSVTYIGYSAFSYCYNLTSIIVDSANENYKAIDGNLYTKDGKTLLQYAIGKKDNKFAIPDGVITIGDNAFGDSKLTSISIPDGVTTICERAFSSYRLTSIEIPDSVTTIGIMAFSDCRNLTSITFAGTVEQWNAISKDVSWNYDVPATEVICSDGAVNL